MAVARVNVNKVCLGRNSRDIDETRAVDITTVAVASLVQNYSAGAGAARADAAPVPERDDKAVLSLPLSQVGQGHRHCQLYSAGETLTWEDPV